VDDFDDLACSRETSSARGYDDSPLERVTDIMFAEHQECLPVNEESEV
jgi:hypothetical protein